jgi:hypothetical protein
MITTRQTPVGGLDCAQPGGAANTQGRQSSGKDTDCGRTAQSDHTLRRFTVAIHNSTCTTITPPHNK